MFLGLPDTDPVTLVRGMDPDPDPALDPDPVPHVFGPPGSGSGSFYHHAKIVRKTLTHTILLLFLTFYL
jgi:hypothetical protein